MSDSHDAHNEDSRNKNDRCENNKVEKYVHYYRLYNRLYFQ